MIIVGIVFVLCLYIAGAISKVFHLSDQATVGMCMWIFLFAMGSIFYLMSLPHAY